MDVGFLIAGKLPIWEYAIIEKLRKGGVNAKFILPYFDRRIENDAQIRCYNLRGVDIIDRIVNKSLLSQLMNVVFDVRSVDITSRFFWLKSRISNLDLVHLVDEVITPNLQVLNTGKKSVMTVWENIPFNPLMTVKYPGREKWKKILEKVSHFAPVSNDAARMLRWFGVPDEKITKIHAGIDVEMFSRNPNDNLIKRVNPEKKFLILGIGRLQYEKGLTFVLRALKMLKDAKKDFVYIHIGTGNKRYELYIRKLVDFLGLKDEVKLIGSIQYKDLPSYYSIADLFLLPSIPNLYWEEQMGFSTIEAMSAGVIPIVSNHPSTIEVVPDNCGFVIPAGNSILLYESVLSVMDHSVDVKAMIRSCIMHVKKEYNADLTAKFYERLYNNIVNS